ncbi:penicillin-binding protein [Knoellia sinensis KCTC 19936]|uniref:Penicillin-binding protein n=1 Tax=Knoellia sinensis KCTC 19936 TaxID=1385520 RepID=A0A0A0JF81_9MICO|nr:penicillin-binding protein 2 [Knoellia sinensis]KGN34722.1 penicillin-binding protein [Knoellia sinensis KCTC 19936]
MIGPGVRPRDGSAHLGRFLAVAACVGLLFVALFARLGQVQLTNHADYITAAATLNTREIVVPAVRGRILDRNGKPLADNTSVTVVTLERRIVAESDDGAKGLLARVAATVQRPVDELVARTHLCGEEDAPPAPACWSGSPQVPIPVASGVDPERALSLVEQPDRFPGVAVESVPMRSYPAPLGVNGAHLLGYLGRASDKEVAASNGTITADDLVGRAGLEQQYDAVLRGTPGRTVVSVDPRGLVTGVVSRTDPVPGRDLVTSIDAGVQAAAEKALTREIASARARGLPADSGSAVVLDVANGEVVALASAPTYDPNVWTGGISAKEYAALTSPTAGTPLVSRATGTALAPASTLKALSVPAAVAAGNPLNRTYECAGSYRIGNRTFRNFESRAYGPITFHKALEVSCDTVFYDAAYRSWLALGGLRGSDAKDPFLTTVRDFGLGARTGIDLPGESAGRIPDRAWKRDTWERTKDETCERAKSGYPEVAKTDPGRAAYLVSLAKENCVDGANFRAGDAVNFSIGQGDVATTPLQMGVAYSAIANGGVVRAPRVGVRSVDPVSGAAQAIPAGPEHRTNLPPAVATYLHAALRAVVVSGTAAPTFRGMAADWPVSGKTGTSEVFGKSDTSWFLSYAPTNKPRYAVSVAVSQGGHGSETAAPISRSLHEALRLLPR